MRRMHAVAAVVVIAAAMVVLTGCGGGVSSDAVIVNGGEPQNPLIPTNTNDSNGGRIIDRALRGPDVL